MKHKLISLIGRKFLAVAAMVGWAALFSGCAAGMGFESDPNGFNDFVFRGDLTSDQNYRYETVVEQGFFTAAEEPESYFSLDRNTANYSQIRAQINAGQRVAKDSVRIEELINYFSYDFPAPEEGIGVVSYLSDCPWAAEHKLLTVGVRTEERRADDARNNYVLLVDVSGSMTARVSGQDLTVMDLVKIGIGELVGGLGADDYVSVVVYANGVGVLLEPTAADEEGKEEIMDCVNGLKAEGATYGSQGLRVAYGQAEKYFSAGGNNRVVLMTDGDFNVGFTDLDQLADFVKEKAESGVYLSVLGFGLGNMRDDLMQRLALNGNGNYAYIDTPQEAKKVLSEELSGTLFTVAKNAKAGVVFDPAVLRYRLLGYDMKYISREDFYDSEKDAGEIGSNLTAVAVYELELGEAAEGERLATVSVRYQTPDGGENREAGCDVRNVRSEREDLTFISCVAEFGLVLRDSEYRGQASLASVRERLNLLGEYLDGDSYKREFFGLVERAIASEYYE